MNEKHCRYLELTSGGTCESAAAVPAAASTLTRCIIFSTGVRKRVLTRLAFLLADCNETLGSAVSLVFSSRLLLFWIDRSEMLKVLDLGNLLQKFEKMKEI